MINRVFPAPGNGSGGATGPLNATGGRTGPLVQPVVQPVSQARSDASAAPNGLLGKIKGLFGK
ncbi:hypothetical protein D3C86_2123950 [compost metagenome]